MDGDRRYCIASGKDDSSRSKDGNSKDGKEKPWNLVEDDWDAVMVPVRKAGAFASGETEAAVWSPALGRGIDKWMEKDGWRDLADEDDKEATDVDWSDVAKAPPGMEGDGLTWKELADVMYH